ncbi:hypothetical protein GGTG_14036 [Gaeumannomyces tritici R3-111a-1]|uniref:Uncharacterized protein n=1 Tax=Gaeumannomyces tritici (strain R3-111a-1) TaxID=644352 RepID=J3PKI1_GAET3|nr:hypothetical protein GGTG_14036 [Gaeumannomyces tritici R3-111a-1]EJT68388.1 hypothetical protein GGTG_14036 [Gaeumannomyces tritici R3-111a-1]
MNDWAGTDRDDGDNTPPTRTGCDSKKWTRGFNVVPFTAPGSSISRVGRWVPEGREPEVAMGGMRVRREGVDGTKGSHDIGGPCAERKGHERRGRTGQGFIRAWIGSGGIEFAPPAGKNGPSSSYRRHHNRLLAEGCMRTAASCRLSLRACLHAASGTRRLGQAQTAAKASRGQPWLAGDIPTYGSRPPGLACQARQYPRPLAASRLASAEGLGGKSTGWLAGNGHHEFGGRDIDF